MVDNSSRPTAGLRQWLPRLGLAGIVGAAITVAIACGQQGDRFPAPSNTGGSSSGGFFPPPAGPCIDDDTRDCHEVLGQQGSILACYDGTQTCAGGVWGPCIDGTVRTTPAPPGMPQPFAFGDAGTCGNNPCDPTCQSFGVDAGPDGGSLSIPQNPGGASWQSGSLATLTGSAAGLVNKGLLANCTSAYDCQFDFKCSNPAIANCTHSKCATGGALAVGCDPPASTASTGCVAEICAVSPSCCSTAWTQACVDKVASVCGVVCDQDNGTGVCVPRLANEKNPNCPGFDLTAGIPCDAGIPICNHGMSDLPSQPIRLWLYPANSGHIPAGSPTGSPLPTVCIVTKAIPAGKCVNVTPTECSFNGAQKEIIVNPQNAGLTSPAPIVECLTTNNWTEYGGSGSCGGVVCAGNAVATTQTPVNIFVALDRSGSMTDTPVGATQSKFATAKAALTAFFDDPKAAGTNIYFRGFPDAESSPQGNACTDRNVCSLTTEIDSCATPQVTATLPSATLDSYVNNLGTNSGTPSYIAMAGAVKWATAYKAAHPQEGVGIVFVTDGEPSGNCTKLARDAAAQAALAKAVGVTTYVLGMDGADLTYLDPIAAAGQGHSTCSGTNPCPSPGTCNTTCSKQNQGCATDADCCDGYGACVSGKCASGTNTTACRGLAINASISSFAAIAAKLLSIKQKLTSCTMGISACKGAGAACATNADCCSSVCTGNLCVGGQAAFDTVGASLVYTDGLGNSTVEPYQTSVTGCGGTANNGWYFDNPAAPSTVSLCSKTCTTVQADANPQVNLTLACPPPYSKSVITLQYEANCPVGTPQWGYFSYDTTTPLDSSIVFYGQYAGTATGLCTINSLTELTACMPSLYQLAAPGAPDPDLCDVNNGGAGCPVDVFAKTGSKLAQPAAFFQLVIDLNPSTGGLQTPAVNNINLSYSCPPTD